MLAQATAAAAAQHSPAYPRLQAQAEELEGVFLNSLLKEMFGSIKTDQSAMGGGFAEETWRGMQAEQLGDTIARAGGIGLADSLMTSLLAAQEASQAQPQAQPNAGVTS